MDSPPSSRSSSREPPMGASPAQPPAGDSTSSQLSSLPPSLSSSTGPSSSQHVPPPAPSSVSGTPVSADSASSADPETSTNLPGTRPSAPATTADSPALPFRGVIFSSVRVPHPMELVSPAMILLVITVGYIVGIFDRDDQVDMNILFLVPGYTVRQFFSWAEAIAYYTERFNAGDVRIVQPVRPNPAPTASSSLAPTPTALSSAPIPPSSDPPRPTSSTASAANTTVPASSNASDHPPPTRSKASGSSGSSRSAVASSSAKVDPTARFGTKPNPIPIGYGSPLTARAICLSRQYGSPTRSTSMSRMNARGLLGSPVRPFKRLRIIKSRKNTTEGKTPAWDDSDNEPQVMKSRKNKGKAPIRNSDNDVFASESNSTAGTGAPPSYSAAVASTSSNPPPLEASASSTSSAPSDPSAPLPPWTSDEPGTWLFAPPTPDWGRGPSHPGTPHPPYSADDFVSGRSRFTTEDQELFERLGKVIFHQWATAATPSEWPSLSDEAHERCRSLLRVIGEHMVGLYPRYEPPSQASSSSLNAANGLINGVNGTVDTGAGSSSQGQAADAESPNDMDTSGDGDSLGDGLERPGEPGAGSQ